MTDTIGRITQLTDGSSFKLQIKRPMPQYYLACWVIWNQTDEYIVGLTHDTLKSAEDLIEKHNWTDCIIIPLYRREAK